MKCPSTIQLEITDDFNLKCLNCYYLNNKEEVVIKFSEANKEKIMQIAQKIVDLGVFQVILTGGESLIKKNLILDFIEFFSKHNISVCINTDLISLNESFFKDPRSNFIKSFLISCTSSNNPKIYKEIEWDGNYDIFERNLKMLQKYNVYCFVALK